LNTPLAICDCCDEVEAKNLLTRMERKGEVVAVSKEMVVFIIVATYTNTTLGRNTLILQNIKKWQTK